MKLYRSSYSKLIQVANTQRKNFFLQRSTQKKQPFLKRPLIHNYKKQPNYALTRKTTAKRSFRMFIPMSGTRKCGGCGRH